MDTTAIAITICLVPAVVTLPVYWIDHRRLYLFWFRAGFRSGAQKARKAARAAIDRVLEGGR